MVGMRVIHKVSLLPPFSGGKNLTPLYQIIRHRGGVSPHNKPRWLPVAPSKKFLLPPEDFTPDKEVEEIIKLKLHHREKMAAVTQYLWEEYLRNSEVGQAAIIQAEKEEQEHKILVQENEETNKLIAKQREERLRLQLIEDSKRIEKEVAAHKENLFLESQRADSWLTEQQQEIDGHVRAQDVERAIETALDNPVDYEFAIDLKGYIYRGRYTKSIEVPEDQKEKLPASLTVAERILSGKDVIRLKG